MPFNTQQSLIPPVPMTQFVLHSPACFSVCSTSIHCIHLIQSFLPHFSYEPFCSTTSNSVEPPMVQYSSKTPPPNNTTTVIECQFEFGGRKKYPSTAISKDKSSGKTCACVHYWFHLMLHSFWRQKPATLEYTKSYTTG